jgi:SSS family solute:Na+ symporter
MHAISTADLLVFFTYFILVSVYGYLIYRHKKAETNSSSHSFFLAEGSLTWWAIGASIIASNISAEQFIGMSGDGFFAGIAVAVYEWLGAAALIIVAVFFMPIYIKNKIYTMPQFLQDRYNSGVALVMSIFWLFLYVFINLTAILFLGSLAINSLLGGQYFHQILIGLAIFAIVIALGGMQVVGYTDVIQVGVLIIGGLAITYLSLTIVSDKFGFGQNALTGFKLLLKDSPDHFHLIFKKPLPGASIEKISKYLILPGFAMYAGGSGSVT